MDPRILLRQRVRQQVSKVANYIVTLIKLSFLENIKLLTERSGIIVLISALVIASFSCICLYQGAKQEDAYYSFCIKEVFPASFCTILGVVLLAPPTPSETVSFLKVLSMVVCFSIFVITTVTDEKTGEFPLEGIADTSADGIIFFF